MNDAANSPPAAPTGAVGHHPDHPNWAGPKRFAFLAAVVGIALYAVAGGVNLAAAKGDAEAEVAKRQFFLSYLVGYVYWMSLPVGGMALLFIHYLVKTSWGVLLRRPLEAATRTFPLLVLLFLPLAFATTLGHASPYWWSSPEKVELSDPHKTDAHPVPAPGDAAHAPKDAAGQVPGEAGRAKALELSRQMVRTAVAHEQEERQHGTFGYLSTPMYLGVGLAIFALFGVFIYFLNKWGDDAQRDPNKVLASQEKLKNMCGPALILYAILITSICTQQVMSLEPSWASTMFPVIFAVNQFLTCFAFCLALFLTLAARPPLKNILRDKFQLDMGTLLLAFTLFWSYTSFSQMMLIWIGNLPEEIPFYLKRSNPVYGGWWWVSVALIAMHFALPFLLLLFRDVKLHPGRLRAVAVYLLVICAVDVTWWIEPTWPHESGPLYLLMDVGALVGVGGVWGLWFLSVLSRRPLLPANELYQLPEGHAHHEHH